MIYGARVAFTGKWKKKIGEKKKESGSPDGPNRSESIKVIESGRSTVKFAFLMPQRQRGQLWVMTMAWTRRIINISYLSGIGEKCASMSDFRMEFESEL